jgi:hypothetical protein
MCQPRKVIDKEQLEIEEMIKLSNLYLLKMTSKDNRLVLNDFQKQGKRGKSTRMRKRLKKRVKFKRNLSSRLIMIRLEEKKKRSKRKTTQESF